MRDFLSLSIRLGLDPSDQPLVPLPKACFADRVPLAPGPSPRDIEGEIEDSVLCFVDCFRSSYPKMQTTMNKSFLGQSVAFKPASSGRASSVSRLPSTAKLLLHGPLRLSGKSPSLKSTDGDRAIDEPRL